MQVCPAIYPIYSPVASFSLVFWPRAGWNRTPSPAKLNSSTKLDAMRSRANLTGRGATSQDSMAEFHKLLETESTCMDSKIFTPRTAGPMCAAADGDQLEFEDTPIVPIPEWKPFKLPARRPPRRRQTP